MQKEKDAMPNLTFSIKLPRCPHCNVADPLLQNRHYLETTDGNNGMLQKVMQLVDTFGDASATERGRS
jgi:hypothetical protein